jgi:hypothetical protein
MPSLATDTHVIGPALVLEAKRCQQLARKLRWLGMDREAEKVTARLPRFLSEMCILVETPDTD